MSPPTNGTKSNESSAFDLEQLEEILHKKSSQDAVHYDQIHPLGKGSTGEVHSARDILLGRKVAIKSIKTNLRNDQDVVARLVKEARATAQLEHPNIMPIHEMGHSEKFGIYFTMKKMEGETLKEILQNLNEHPSFFEKTYSLHRLLEIFLSVCNAISFAHSRGVIHRDLKPANIMVGPYGEVLVLDWGLVKNINEEESPSENSVHLKMDDINLGNQTLDGSISGTPFYMSPEQANGQVRDIDVYSDIYSLGAILYHILARCTAFEKMPLHLLLENVRNGNFEPPSKRSPDLKIPKELEAICLKAMALHPVARYRSVEKMALDIRNYITHEKVSVYKANRRERFWNACRRHPVKASVYAAVSGALLLAFGVQYTMHYGAYATNVHRAQTLCIEVDNSVAQAEALYDQLQNLSRKNPFKEKTPQEIDLQNQIETLRRRIETHYETALSLYLSVPKSFQNRRTVIDGYKEIMKNRIELAIHFHEYDLAQQWKDTVELNLQEMGIRKTTEAEKYLANIQQKIEGNATLHATGSDQIESILLWPLTDTGERQVLDEPIAKGSLPLDIPCLKKGSYIFEVTLKNGSKIPYPLYLSHGEERNIYLEAPPPIPSDMVYIPAGPFFFGGEDSRFYRLQQRTLPAFFIKKTEVTVAEYLEFWKSLPDPQQRAAYISRIQFNPQIRHYQDAWNTDGVLDSRIKPEFPIVGITHQAAEAFCQWKSKKTGRPLRLPTAEEWEKAARGVDGRRYVWGNGFNCAFAYIKSNVKAKETWPYWAPPAKFKFTDCSVYNAFDLAGNVREMTCSSFPDCQQNTTPSSLYQVKGASGSTPTLFLPCAYVSDTSIPPSDIGFRYIQEIPQQLSISTNTTPFREKKSP